MLAVVAVVGGSVAAPANAADCPNNDPKYGYCVSGKILQEFVAAGGGTQAGGLQFFGNATIPESNTQNGGKYQKFVKSRSIYWHPTRTGGSARAIGGLIRDTWVARGYELGDHGYPTTREPNARTPGKYNRFESGGIYWKQGKMPKMRGTEGCVIANVVPVWDLSVYPDLDQYRKHVSLAQQSGIAGFPNASGQGNPLNRTTSDSRRTSNRRQTCGGVTGA